jgi:GNAT superfamily N-acetyltransferase
MTVELERVDKLTEAQVPDLVALYQKEWWTKGRQLADVRRLLAHADIVVAYCERESRRLVAFARVLTDGVYKALIFDVIVADSHRDLGLGRVLMDAIVEHPKLKTVRHLELHCLPELIPFYQRWGFTDELGELHFMRLAR